MKKSISILLCLMLMLSMTVPAFAADYSTQVSYTGQGVEEYTVTVPATLAPGGSGTVKAIGTWSTERTLSVLAPSTVTLTCDIDSNDTKSLAVTFAGIALAGDNTVVVQESKAISVADITNALFGTWSGTITYSVVMCDDNILPPF